MQFCKIETNKTLQLYSTVSFFGGRDFKGIKLDILEIIDKYIYRAPK